MRWGGAQDGTGRRRVPHRTDTVVATLARDRWRALVGFGYVLTGSVGEAEDLAQEALVRAVVRGRDGAELHAVEAYVRRTMTRLHVDAARRRRRWRDVEHLLVTPDDAPVDADLEVVREALAGLSPRERACVVLRHLEDLGVAETADLLGISTGAVKRYTSDGIERLEARVGPVRRVGHEIAPVDRGSR